MRKAIVIGGHVQGLGIVRVLGRLGYTVSVLDKTKLNIARHSRFCSSFNLVSNNDLIAYLLSEAGIQRHQDSIIFPTNDEHVEHLSKNLNVLNKYYTPATDTWDIIEKCFNKRLTYTIAKESKIPIAKTYYPDTTEELERLKNKIQYPCIIKPAVMYRFYNSFKQKVFICNNKKELMEFYQKAISIIPAEEIIIQDIIPGGSEYQYSVGYLFNRTEKIVSLTAKRLRQHPIDFGNATTYAQTVIQPELEEFAFKILEKMNYQGLCEVEFKLDYRDGEFKFLEVNPRTWKWHSISESAGIPFIDLYTSILDGNANSFDSCLQQEATWQDPITDIPIQILMKIKGLKNETNVIKNKQQAVFDNNDLKPFIFQLLYIPFLIKSR